MCALLVGLPDVRVVGVGEWPQWLRIVIAIHSERPSCCPRPVLTDEDDAMATGSVIPSTASDAHVSFQVGQTRSNDRSAHTSTTRSSPGCTWCQGWTPANHTLAGDGGGATSYATTSTPRRASRAQWPVPAPSSITPQGEQATIASAPRPSGPRTRRPQDLNLEWLIAGRPCLGHEKGHIVQAPALGISPRHLCHRHDLAMPQPRAARVTVRAKTFQLAAASRRSGRCARSVGVSHAAIMPLSLNGAPLGFGPYTEGSILRHRPGPSSTSSSTRSTACVNEPSAAGQRSSRHPLDHDYGSRDFLETDRQRNVSCFGTSQPGS